MAADDPVIRYVPKDLRARLLPFGDYWRSLHFAIVPAVTGTLEIDASGFSAPSTVRLGCGTSEPSSLTQLSCDWAGVQTPLVRNSLAEIRAGSGAAGGGRCLVTVTAGGSAKERVCLWIVADQAA